MNPTPPPGRFIGIDVSQRTLHVACADQSTVHTVPNDVRGHAQLQALLGTAALVATRFHPELKAFYERLLARGKPKKVAQTACMRKLLVCLNAMQRDHATYRPPALA